MGGFGLSLSVPWDPTVVAVKAEGSDVRCSLPLCASFLVPQGLRYPCPAVTDACNVLCPNSPWPQIVASEFLSVILHPSGHS